MSTAETTTKAQASNDADTGLKPADKKLLYSVLTHLKGHVNFENVASDIEVANAEAARKRLRRFLEREQITTTIKGDRIGGIEDKEGSTGIAKASTKKAAKAKTPITTEEPREPKSAVKKRKAAEMTEDQTEIKVEVGTTKNHKDEAGQEATNN